MINKIFFLSILISTLIYTQPLVVTNLSEQTTYLSSDFVANSKGHKKFLLGVNTGYRFNISVNPDLNSNFLFCFSIQLPLSEFVSLQPELNFWETDLINYPVARKYSVTDIPILLMLNVNYEKTGIDLLFGPGVIVPHDDSDKLITLNIGIGYWIKLIERLRLNFEGRLQLASSLAPGGGNSFSSVFVRMGLKYALGN